MSTFMRIATVAILAVGLSSVSGQSFATDTREAIKLCEKNPGCDMRQEGDRIIMTIKGSGPKYIVDCPMRNGSCTPQRRNAHQVPNMNLDFDPA